MEEKKFGELTSSFAGQKNHPLEQEGDLGYQLEPQRFLLPLVCHKLTL